jgi:hypothetical protein
VTSPTLTEGRTLLTPAWRLLAIAAFVGLASGCTQGGFGPTIQAGTQDCGPVEATPCRAAVANATADADKAVAGFQIRCTAPICNDISGSIDLIILWRDGTSETRSASWAAGPFDPTVFGLRPPIPIPPVAPTCVEVPEAECQSEWTTAMENVPAAQVHNVTLVLVQCTGRCTPDSGVGQTIIGFQDGTRIRSITWSYTQAP